MNSLRRTKRRKGVILSLLAVLSIFLVVIVMFFVDVAYMQLTRTELQAATDAAAKAACESIDATSSVAQIKQVALDVAAANTVGGSPLILDADDIVVGQSDLQADGSWLFQPGAAPFTAVQINSMKSDAKSSGAVNLFFAGAFGTNSFTPSQESVASQFDHEIMLCVDRSHSMCFDFSGVDWSYPAQSDDPNWDPAISDYCHRPHINSRWAALRAAVNVFLDSVDANNSHEQQRVGLVTWASAYNSPCSSTAFPASRVDAQLGLNFNQVRTAIDIMGTQPMQGATNMSAGLNAAINVLNGAGSNPLAKKTIILFTDGQWNTGDAPSTITSTASASNITIHIVTLLGNLDMSEMDDLSDENGGIHYNASTQAELIAAFDTLARSLPVVLTQ